MAEGGINTSSAKSKPVPPPKPSGTVVTSCRTGLRKSFDPAKVTESNLTTLGVGIKSSTTSVGEHAGETRAVSSPQTSKVLSKPPLLPKPHLADIQSKRPERSNILELSGQTLKTAISNVSGAIRKQPTKLFIPSHKFDVEHESKASTTEAKAPVAKLDEFDHVGDQVSPVRPPRSPKHKSLIGGPFLTEAGRRQQLALHQVEAKSKSLSLGRNVELPIKLRSKTNSLGRNVVRDIAQELGNSGSSYADNEDRSPVRPPRRRNKSVMQSPEVNSSLHQQKQVAFNFDGVESRVPVYAQVNYSLKKNRRSIETKSNEIPGNEENMYTICAIDSEIVETVNSEVVCSKESGLETIILDEMPKTLCSVYKKRTEGVSEREVKEEVVDSDYTYLSFTSNRNEYQSKSQLTNHQESVESQTCSELCADCLPVQILEDSCNDSISSGKLDWQSVRSSFNSSDSDAAMEIGNVQPHLGVTGESSELSDHNVVKLCESSDSHFPKDETKDFSKKVGSRRIWCSKHHDFSCNCETNSSNVSGNSVTSEMNMRSPLSERRRHYKRLTSSLPNRKTNKNNMKDTRRQSWTGYKDSEHYGELKSPWLDEGDSSSGNIGDVDSSDNAVKQSSGEEVDSRNKSDQSVSRRLNLWFSSFGKSGKKNRNAKRYSHFYSEEQSASVCKTETKESMYSAVKHLSVRTSGSPSPQASSCSFLSAPSTPKLPYNDFSDKVASKESVVSDLQSDSDREGDDGNLEENQSLIESLKDDKRAYYIALELMTSEQVFIDALKLLNENFRGAIQKASSHGQPIIPPAEFDKILSSLPQLQSLNEDLWCDLKERIQNWSSLKKIADVIVKKGPFLKLYTTYIQNFEAQCNFFDECCQKYPKFAKAVKEFEASSVCQKLSVKHYMLKPVQRIPQYRLLLDDYSRHLQPSSPDYNDTQNALKIVCEVADHANRSLKLGDNLSVLLQLQSQLGNYEIIKPGRLLLKDGELYKLSRKERQPRFFILLNDCLLYTSYYGSGPSSGLKVNCELSLGGMKVTIPQAEDYHNEFSIISSTRSFTLSARSSTERQEWVEALQNAIQEYTSRQLSFQVQKLNISRPDGSSEPFKLGKEAPIWIQDGRVTKCQLCVAEFTVTFRRHHCRACGKVICGICSAFRAPLQYMKFQSDRVCEDCFNTLLREFDTPGNKITDLIKHELGLKRCDQNTLGSIRSQFKRLGATSGKKTKKHIPQRLLEVTANDAGSQMCGWLQRRSKRSWKRLWFVLKEQVLYVYKASEDVVALESIPVLGYKVEPMKQIHFQLYEGIDAKLVFQLAHPNQQPLVFSADSENLVQKWITELLQATILK